MEILNDNLGADKAMAAVGTSEALLSDSANKLDLAGYKLALEEVAYDEKCLEVYLGKLASFEIRTMQLKDDWNRKKLDMARQAAETWIHTNVAQ